MTQTTDKSQMGFTAAQLQGLTTAPANARIWSRQSGGWTSFTAVTEDEDRIHVWESDDPGWALADMSAQLWLKYADGSKDWTEITPDDDASDLADAKLVMFAPPILLSGPVPIEVGYGHIEGDASSEVVTLSVDGRGLALTADRVGELATILAGIADAVAGADDTKVYGS